MKTIPNNLKYPLTVKAAKIVVPVYLYNLSEAEQLFIFINSLQYTKTVPLATTKGYRQYLNENKNDENLLRNWKYNKLMPKSGDYRMLLDRSWGYINLQDLYNFAGSTIDVQHTFKTYLQRYVYDQKSFELYVKQFFKYMPYITSELYVPKIDTGGYCCKDCDGNYNDYIKNRTEHECEMLSFKVRDLLIVNYTRNEKFGEIW